MLNNENQGEPAVGFRYLLSISGNPDPEESGFSEISGLSAELETESFSAGGENNLLYNLPKQVKTTPLVVKRGMFNLDSALINWVKEVVNEGFPDKIQTEDIIIQLMNEKNEIIITWTLHNAFPTKWEVNGFNAMENKLLIESITFSYTNFEMDFN